MNGTAKRKEEKEARAQLPRLAAARVHAQDLAYNSRFLKAQNSQKPQFNKKGRVLRPGPLNSGIERYGLNRKNRLPVAVVV
jgi:hypothetical protein